jgi:transaldolase
MVAVMLLSCAQNSYAFKVKDLLKEADKLTQKKESKTDDQTKISGLKEALSIGTDNAVKRVSRVDGYFGNQLIKIPLPEETRKVMAALSKMGFKKQVDEFVLTMNRGAEKAAPQAVSIFVNAIKAMTIEDAGTILLGNDTAATEYFKKKTNDDIYQAFKPVIAASLDAVGATKAYKSLMDKTKSVRLLKQTNVDLDHYVTNKAIGGLFLMVGQEEKKIRLDPAARTTELLRTVFGGK